MPHNHGEYTRPSVASGGCSYSTLYNYNQDYYGRGLVGAPTLAQARSHETIIVPSYGGPGYQNLVHSTTPTCTGYYSIDSAYPSYPNACGQFNSRLCG